MENSRVVILACVLAKFIGRLAGSFECFLFSKTDEVNGYDQLLYDDLNDHLALEKTTIEKSEPETKLESEVKPEVKQEEKQERDLQMEIHTDIQIAESSINIISNPDPNPNPAPVLVSNLGSSPITTSEHKTNSIKPSWKARARDKVKLKEKTKDKDVDIEKEKEKEKEKALDSINSNTKLKLIGNELSSVKEEYNTFCEKDLPKKRMPAA
ncbi:MAG: hypothetical protein HQK49_04690 [Oligoflexia bacterium]|nr:hypothetical protein [Oligoflexia bacterium]